MEIWSLRDKIHLENVDQSIYNSTDFDLESFKDRFRLFSQAISGIRKNRERIREKLKEKKKEGELIG